MARSDRVKRALVAPLLVLALAGCQIVDRFSGRAVDYNLEAEQVQDQELLLNVIRSSQRRPLQFTGLQSITGTASESGSTSWTFPFGEATHRPRTAASPDVFALTTSISGGPTFTVPVLDTQEFYQGILNPISLQIFDFYIKQNYPKELLFDLLIAEVDVVWVVGEGKNAKTIAQTYRNTPNSDAQLDAFHSLIEYFLAMGMTTERIETTKSFGAPIASGNLAPNSTAVATQVLDAYAHLADAGLDITQDSKTKDYQLQKKQSEYRLCFTQQGSSDTALLKISDPSLFCGQFHAAKGNSSQGIEIAGTSELSDLNDLSDALNIKGDPTVAPGAPPRHLKSLRFSIRSTEGIIYYIGEVVRRQLFPELETGGATRIIQTKTRIPAGYVPKSPCDPAHDNSVTPIKGNLDNIFLSPAAAVNAAAPASGSTENASAGTYYCENIFYVTTGMDTLHSFISVDYDGSSYGLSNDLAQAGRSYQVLELVKQLLALNTSAKSLPAANVLSIITSP